MKTCWVAVCVVAALLPLPAHALTKEQAIACCLAAFGR